MKFSLRCDIAYAEIALTETMPAMGTVYWGNGPAFPKVQPQGYDEKLNNTQASLIRLKVLNQGEIPVSDIEVRYYFKMPVGVTPEQRTHYSPQALSTLVNNGNGLWHMSFKYNNVTINPGESTENGNGLVFELWNPGWTSNWNAKDDPSYLGMGSAWSNLTGVTVFDGHGNLIYGTIPAGTTVESPNTPAPPESNVAVRMMAKENQPNNTNLLELMGYVENMGTSPLTGFKVKYCFVESQTTAGVVVEPWDLQFAKLSTEAWGIGKCAVLDYGNTVINPGGKSDWAVGFKLGFHHVGYTVPWNRSDDASFAGLGADFKEAHNMLITDNQGQVLWGKLPSPPQAGQNVVDPGILKINNGVLTIQVPTTGIYSLGVVGASGTWLKTIFSGTWNKGVTELDLKAENLISGQYIVLRQGSVVLDQIIWP